MASSAYADFTNLNHVFNQTPQREGFEICYSGGCVKTAYAKIDEVAYKRIAEVFTPAPNSAEEEREAIKLAIGLMEDIVGRQTGTEGDRAGTFDNSDYLGQLDCNDEATNSTTYMKLLISAGLVKFHKVTDLKRRNFFFTGWPHTTAVIQETATGAKFALDSWFHDNGKPAEIVPLELWLENWRPKESHAE